jgi:hypothetical protein
MSYVTKEQLQTYRDFLVNELSAFLKECPTCKQKFKDTLDKRIICINCDRDQKLNKILENDKL